MLLEPLTKESTMIAEAAAGAPEGRYATGVTAGEWFKRRTQNRRIKNQTVSMSSCIYMSRKLKFVPSQGPETWMASRGTEQQGAY